MRIYAPFSEPVIMTLLPEPDFSDVIQVDAEVQIKVSMNNSLRSYVRTNEEHELTLDWTSLPGAKMAEVRELTRSLSGYEWLVYLSHRDIQEVWRVVLLEQPNYQTNARSVGCAPTESGSMQLRLAGKKQ